MKSMHRPLVVALLGLALAGVRSAAQAPRITAAGDPSVLADSIYRLAVDPARYPDQDMVYLLDDGVVRLEADGRGTRTFRQIVQVLRPSAVRRLQEQTFSYSPQHEKLAVNWMRVVRPDGSVVSDKPSHVQESDVPAPTDDPLYSDRKLVRSSLSGVAPGTIVDYSYTTEELKPFLPRDFLQLWNVSTGLQVARSRFVLDLPVAVTPRIEERNLDFKRAERVVAGRRIYTWATANLPRIEPEPLAADSNAVLMTVRVGSPLSWQDVGRWYAGLARAQEVASPSVAAKVDSLVRGARTRADSIRAVHKWVAQDIRYVAIELGLGGYQPRAPEQVLRTGFGDCKDKATLFVSAMRHLGLEAYPVLLSSRATARRELPSILQFNHEIAAVATDGGWQFVDLTAGVVPYGELPWAEQGGFALLVRPDGRIEEVTLPKDSLTANRSTIRVAGVLDSTGVFNGTYEEFGDGAAQYGLRSAFYNPLDSAQTRNGGNAIARKLFEGADGDSLTGFDGRNLAARPHLRVLIRHGRAATPAGATMILQMPLSSMAPLATAAQDLERRGTRRFPINPAGIWGARTSSSRFDISLPAGWHAQLPKSVTASSPFGSYRSSYVEQNGTLTLTRDITGATTVQPPEKIAELVAWLKAVASDDAKFIVLTRTPADGGGR
jgi:transglutaminase-like putative cysteine protease